VTVTEMPGRMPQTRTPPTAQESPSGFNRQSSSTSWIVTISSPRNRTLQK
jgi:hypothetical protein